MECPKFNKFGKLTVPVVTDNDNDPVVLDYNNYNYNYYNNFDRITRNSTCYGKENCY